MTSRKFTVLVLGGYGTFGSRIARRIGDFNLKGLEIIIAGRSESSASKFAREMNTKYNFNQYSGISVDVTNKEQFKHALETNKVDLVVHTAGPFQSLDYLVPRTAIEAGVHYVDLSDGRRYVCDFKSELDVLAVKNNVVAICGASSVPAVSSAAIDSMLPFFSSIDELDIGMSPGNQSPRGPATVASILTYCGKKISVTENGKPASVIGWQRMHAVHYPAPVGTRWECSCDIADLELFPSNYNCRTVTFSAGIELTIFQISMMMLAQLTKIGLVDSLVPYANTLSKMSEWFRWFGSTRGGMHVKVTGTCRSTGRPLTKTFFMLADGKAQNSQLLNTSEACCGPEIPCTPAVVVAEKLAIARLTGQDLPFKTGAYPCVSAVNLHDITKSLAKFNIWTEVV